MQPAARPCLPAVATEPSQQHPTTRARAVQGLPGPFRVQARWGSGPVACWAGLGWARRKPSGAGWLAGWLACQYQIATVTTGRTRLDTSDADHRPELQQPQTWPFRPPLHLHTDWQCLLRNPQSSIANELSRLLTHPHWLGWPSDLSSQCCENARLAPVCSVDFRAPNSNSSSSSSSSNLSDSSDAQWPTLVGRSMVSDPSERARAAFKRSQVSSGRRH
ncbi:hypothetical protein BD289DRAFT_110030 [Coniella lustricola]|uniref:Uncharacterized protein n=1 Tax=Coniella lustricola TaxID=2025994 RepID=A0A2T2ZXD1_9PEZI|nr:hypothetical protein BD289DRAFT_110030 [Coniella lustricola]